MENVPCGGIMKSQHYYNRYIKFIEGCLSREKFGYTEKHHIIPKSLGGNNSKENIIHLSGREHFIAHWLLWKTYRNVQMAKAFNLMKINPSDGVRYTNSRAYEVFKSEYSILLSTHMSGENHHNFGKTTPQTVKQKISKSLLNRKRSKESTESQVLSRLKNKKSSGMLGKSHTKEFKDNQSKQMSGALNPMAGSKRMWINDGITNFLIDYSDILPENMYRGRLKWVY